MKISSKLEIVQKFFGIKTTYAISNLARIGYHCLQECKNKYLIEELKKLDLFKDKEELLDALHEVALDRNIEEGFPEEIKKTPPKLQEYPQVWMYYSFFHQLKMNERSIDEKFDDIGKSLFCLPLYFHKEYFNYKKNEGIRVNIITREVGFYEIVARALTRISDILIHFYNYDSKYLNELYFSNSEQNLFHRFFYILHQYPEEANSFVIHEDEKLDKFYTLYKNQKKYIEIPIAMSRILVAGEEKKPNLNEDKDTENHKIKYYILNGEKNFQDLVNLNFQIREYTGGGLRERNPSQYTEEDTLLHDSIMTRTDSKIIVEDRLELDEKRAPKNRSIDYDDNKNISNGQRQSEINKAFSAKITKTRLLLPNHYTLPPIEHISDFLLKIIFHEKFYSDFNEEDFFKVVFLLNISVGISYDFIVKIFFSKNDKKDIYPNIYYEDGQITMTFDTDKIYSKKMDSKFFVNTKKRVIYHLPDSLKMLVKDIQRKLVRMDVDKYNTLKEEYYSNSKYTSYINEWVSQYPKRINIKVNELWRIQATYRTKFYSEDLTSMLCTSVYQSKSLSGLPYSSVNQSTKEFTEWLEKLFEKLNGSTCVNMALNIEFKSSLNHSDDDDKKVRITGSNRILKKEIGKKFFDDVYQMMIVESDSIKYFNMFSLYLIYAMSLLVGTRDFYGSASFRRISFELKTLVISEKSQALLSGARVIPLCDTIITMIKKYIDVADSVGIKDISDVKLILDNKVVPYTKNNSMKVFTEYKLDYFMIDFIDKVPLNIGRHIMTYYATKDNVDDNFVKAYKGHYFAGSEQFGVFSTLDIEEYMAAICQLNEKISDTYGIK